MTKRFFITSSGTNVGKTLVTAALAHQLLAAGKNVLALKPVISGYDATDASNDTAQLLAAQQLSAQSVDALSPWRFAAPLSPHMAAEKENRSLVLSEIVDFCNAQTADIVLVEGVGGVMVPLNNTHTTLDWMVALQWPVVLVVGSYLGAISHGLTALSVLNNAQMDVQAIIVSESPESMVDFQDTVLTFERFSGNIPIIAQPRVHKETERWKAAVNLLPVISHG